MCTRPLLKLNNVILVGTYETEDSAELQEIRTTPYLLNTLTINKSQFRLYLANHITYVLNNHPAKLLSETLNEELGKRVRITDLKVSNAHYSRTLPLNAEQIRKDLLPKLSLTVDIPLVEVTQEQNLSTKTTLEAFLREEKFSFINVKLVLANRCATVKFQVDKKDKATHVTIIVGKYCPDTFKAISFFNENGYDRVPSTRV